MTSNEKNVHAGRLEKEIARADKNAEDASIQAHKIMKYQKCFEGKIEVESDHEKTYMINQEQLRKIANPQTERKRFDLHLPALGPYMCNYSANGNALLLGGKKGHIAAMNWKSFTLQSEFQLHETCRSVEYLNDEQLFAVAQSKYTYIYSREGVEVHQLRDLANLTALEYLPQHFLLSGGSKSGLLSWFDVSVGKLIALRRSRMGPICQLTRDLATNVLAAGHLNGQITMWVPSCQTPVLKIAGHRSSIVDLSYDKSGTYLATLGADACTRIWDLRTMKMLNQIYTPMGYSLDISHRNLLAVGFGSRVEIWNDSFSVEKPKKPLIAHNFAEVNKYPYSVCFCPFEDILGVGHNYGFSSILVPGAGIAEPDFFHANPFETAKQMRDRPIYQLLDKPDPATIRLSNAPGMSFMKPRQVALLKQKKMLSEIEDASEAVRECSDQQDFSDTDIVEKRVVGKRLEYLTSEAQRLERQHKHERKMKKMNGVEKYKLKQRSQARLETREIRRSLKKQRRDKETSVACTNQQKQRQEDGFENAAKHWFQSS